MRIGSYAAAPGSRSPVMAPAADAAELASSRDAALGGRPRNARRDRPPDDRGSPSRPPPAGRSRRGNVAALLGARQRCTCTRCWYAATAAWVLTQPMLPSVSL
jgi:hypothetical protein